MGGGPDSRCVGRVYGADGDVYGTIQTKMFPRNFDDQLPTYTA